MKKIIKIVKNNIFGFILGGIVFGTIGVIASNQLASSSVYYDNSTSGGSSNTVSGAIDELYDMASTHCPDGNVCIETCTKTWARIGDYVQMTPTKTSFTTDINYTGYSSTQTINPSELNLWRVIRINKDCTVDMVSEYVSSTAISFYGTTGIKNFVGYLNILAKQYENSNYTVGSRHVGYKNQTEFITDDTAFKATTAPWSRVTYKDVTVESQGGGDDEYLEDMSLIANAIGGVVTFKANTSSHNQYFIASRFYYVTGTKGFRFSGRVVFTNSTFGFNGGASSSSMHSYENTKVVQYAETASIRPIVTLKSDIKSSSGDGSSTSPYVLN